MIFDAVSRHKSGVLSLEVFKSLITREQASETVTTGYEADDSALITFSGRLPSIKQATELLVAEAMKRAQGNQSIAAKMLGISQQALSKRLKKNK